MAKYSKKAAAKVEKVMHEWKKGKLRSGSGDKVKSQKQAVAIGISEARAEGDKVPAEKKAKKSTAPKKSVSKKAPAKKATSKNESLI